VESLVPGPIPHRRATVELIILDFGEFIIFLSNI
jgi:hypothetical protein